MKNKTENEILIGKVVGYRSGISMLSHNSSVIVNADGFRIVISMDHRQIKFVENEYPAGSQIPLEFYCGKWHISSKPEMLDINSYDPDIMALEIVNRMCKKVAE
ncbi:MAG TPA: hypothetical protein VMC84_13440 [Methanocella sp.]|uniref:hypothetical protein n=1 Tax=Methanocella sp. TaxID=2052833 RepID=UPI002CB5CACC|nr:hypothetical protein [Methanocella sp.]HTY92173.1 hypothetical protein [Methanocella sp.]